jgi:hypothetical protein
MKLAATVVWLALAATVAAGADDAKAPLADSKQQLQQLQRDENSAKSGASDTGLKGALPELKTTMQGREVLPSLGLTPGQDPKDKDRERKREAKKNWLVDGYDRLDPKSANAKSGDTKSDDKIGAEATASDDTEKDAESESGTQDDLIKLYEKQGKSKDATSARGKSDEAKPAHSAPPDPFAPFLQGWLANSPVRDAALSTATHTDGSNGSPADPGPAPVIAENPTTPTGVNGGMLPNSAASAKPENPYLLTLTMPVLPANSPTAAPVFPLGTGDAFANGPVSKPTLNSSVDVLAPPARSDAYKPPTTPADDDKKYFPQLKRF